MDGRKEPPVAEPPAFVPITLLATTSASCRAPCRPFLFDILGRPAYGQGLVSFPGQAKSDSGGARGLLLPLLKPQEGDANLKGASRPATSRAQVKRFSESFFLSGMHVNQKGANITGAAVCRSRREQCDWHKGRWFRARYTRAVPAAMSNE